MLKNQSNNRYSSFLWKKWHVSGDEKEDRNTEYKDLAWGTSLEVQWLGLGGSTAEGTGLILDLGTKIPQAVYHSQKKKKDLAWIRNLRNAARHLCWEQNAEMQ